MLTVIDEYSRFPYAFPCPNIESQTVIRCLDLLFGMHIRYSDRGSYFLSEELTTHLHNHGIATSRTTWYNPQGNGKCERYNGIIWKKIKLRLSLWSYMIVNEKLFLQMHCMLYYLNYHVNQSNGMFSHPQCSGSGTSIPSWLTTPGKLFMKRHVKSQ